MGKASRDTRDDASLFSTKLDSSALGQAAKECWYDKALFKRAGSYEPWLRAKLRGKKEGNLRFKTHQSGDYPRPENVIPSSKDELRQSEKLEKDGDRVNLESWEANERAPRSCPNMEGINEKDKETYISSEIRI
ncbi:hypothetical protein V6N11_045658 [Hibiscus sabdariffa]|uniref:Uncharacterized protein n=1 Tax=Hibiscus sabdariffa TaxID=183260 RepID=A0ABR2Q284_9ROSI